MTPQDRLIVMDRDGVAAEVLDDEAIVMNLATGAYYSLQKAAARAWQLIEQSRSEQEIVALLTAEFEVTREQARRDVETLLVALLEEGLVTTQPADAAGAGTAAGSASAVPAASRRPYDCPPLRKHSEMADMLALDPPLPGVKDLPWKPREPE